MKKELESFQIFAQVKTYGVFNEVVVGFGPKGMPGKMCDSVR